MNYSDGSQRNIRFNGHSIDDANYTFDGIDNNGVQVQVVRRPAPISFTEAPSIRYVTKH